MNIKDIRGLYKASKRNNQKLISDSEKKMLSNIINIFDSKNTLVISVSEINIIAGIMNRFNQENKIFISDIQTKIKNDGIYHHCRKCGKQIFSIDDIAFARCKNNCDLQYDRILKWCRNNPPDIYYRYVQLRLNVADSKEANINDDTI
jgi:hypothetical protein